MKILLIGEYSRLHNSLKEGLEKLGHHVTIIGFGDDFKDYPVDIKLQEYYQTGRSKFLKQVIFKLFKLDLVSRNIQKQFQSYTSQLTHYDVVQLINENAFKTIPKVEKKLLEYIFSHNKNVFLLSCGTDYTSVNYALNKKFKYSILTPYFENRESKKSYYYALKFSTKAYKDLHQYIYKNVKGIIASDLDYHIPLEHNPKYLGLAPNPINTDTLKYSEVDSSNKIVIFHGVNASKYYKKGNNFFTEALEIIQKKHPDKVEILTVTNLPYHEYINTFNKAHIVLDQVYAYDQGFNALEAMAKGKVVFTGAEQDWLSYYNVKENTVAINALPNVEYLVKTLEWLILNPKTIETISKNARRFIESEHYYIDSAKHYLDLWTKVKNA
ncbi:glycosyltransferase family protein [Formosa algae]|uniref:Glycosyltransferase involved in cell wall biosynthesis n=1 Tax=Formosa algae TaxID=225843 RepID=A0A9X1C933_9FLAO|nr:glycosyltransferase [Formosa algae]MBP1839523.1 glycosyltransferase involved in cell wall biosynthesis [Formosa algae]MDQ0334827.1 glycosyltransferase involved in cell wall biosynthesis [Formosa algae]OEI82071.1 glycosyl transferase family 1 [Formosa algae]